MKHSKTSLALAATAVLAVLSGPATAQYPEWPIEVIIPYGPGSNSDTSGRLFINALSAALDHPVVPINVAGAGGTIGTARLATSPTDGYTIGFNPIATVTIQPHLRPVPYGEGSLEPICMIANNPTAVTVAPDSPYQSMDDLIAAARSGEVVAVGGAPGSIPHIVQAAIANAYGVGFTYLPAGGGGRASTAILGGEADFAADTSAMERLFGLRTLAVSAEDRVPELPDVPTFRELGHDIAITIWFGAFAPAGTAEEVLETLSAACEVAVADPAFVEGMAAASYTIEYRNRAEFTEFFDREYQDNREMLRIIGVELD